MTKKNLSPTLLMSALFPDAPFSIRKIVLLCSGIWSCFHILTLANLYYRVTENSLLLIELKYKLPHYNKVFSF